MQASFAATGQQEAARRTAVPVLVLALVLFAALGFQRAALVWQSGIFLDTDDALRMVEVRELLRGAHWFDRVQERMGLAPGLSLHWSRLIDLPLAVLLGLFELALPQAHAERLLRLLWPLATAGAFFWALTRLLRQMASQAPSLAGLLLALTATATMSQFDFGRIDHHGPQIVLLVLAAGAAIRAVTQGSARAGLVAGGLSALSLAISVENLPFLAVIGLALPLAFAWHGARFAPMLRAYAAGLAASSLLLFAALVPPEAWHAAVPDAFSLFHLAALTGGAAVLLLACALGQAGPAVRLAALAVPGLALLAALRLAFPACFGDPLAGVDPLARDLWLANVAEARPLTLLLTRRPDLALPHLIPVMLAIAAALWAAWEDRATRQAAAWLLLAGLLIAGLAAMVWQVRAASSTLPLTIPPALWLVERLMAATGWQEKPGLRLVPWLALLPLSSLFWHAAIPAPSPRADALATDPAACFAPAAHDRLRALPPGLVLASIDSGAHILAQTPHRVLAGAYHRNNAGNVAALESLLAAPEEARRQLARLGVHYVALCPGFADVQIYAERAPDGLAARLVRGDVPRWLEAIPGEASPYRVFRVTP